MNDNIERIKAELAIRKEQERCRVFEPNGKQEDYIRAVGEKPRFITIFSGGNGAGKTYLMANILANIIWGPQNKWFDMPLFRNFERLGWPKRARIGTESANMKESGAIDQAIDYWWPKARYRAHKTGMPYVAQFKTDNGWIVDKMSYEQETREWESATLGVTVFDEPPPRDKYMASVARMRKGGLIMMFMTPLAQAGWIMDELVDSPNHDVKLIYADLEDNCRTHGVRGTLEHANIERMIRQMDPDEVEARAHGKAIHLSNVILGTSFNREFHVIEDDVTQPVGSQLGMVVDPARGKPWAIGWFWVDQRGQLVFDDEYPKGDWTKIKETNMAVPDYVDMLKLTEKGKRMEWRVIDRHYANARNDYGTTLKQDLFEKFGYDFMDSYNCENEVEIGIQRVKDYLAFNRKMPIDGQNFPKLRIKRRCYNIIRSLERWQRDPQTLQPDTQSPYKDHFDLVRYAVMAGLEADIRTSGEVPKPRIYALGRGQ